MLNSCKILIFVKSSVYASSCLFNQTPRSVLGLEIDEVFHLKRRGRELLIIIQMQNLLFAHCPNNCFITVDEAYKAVTASFEERFHDDENKDAKYKFPVDCKTWGCSVLWYYCKIHLCVERQQSNRCCFQKACVVVVCKRKSRENKQRSHWNLDQSRTQW